MELMNRVRAILDERNISQASFARKIDVSPQLRHSQSERTGFFCPFTTFTGFPYKRTVYIPALIAYTFR